MATPMLTKLRESKTVRGLAVLSMLTFVGDLIYPTLSHALTGGPTQPEVQQFQQAGASNLVNLATGDMSYGLDLFTVPGPNGGYPIKLSYIGGSGMEEEASWTGADWNINVGAVNRQMRGLPDDFKGDDVVKKRNIKASHSLAVSGDYIFDQKIEKFGFPIKPLSFNTQLYWNNSDGVGFKLGLSTETVKAEAADHKEDAHKSGVYASGQFDFEFDSQKGLDFGPTISAGAKGKKSAHKFELGSNFGDRQGLDNISLKYDYSKIIPLKKSFSRSSYVPGQSFPMTGFTAGVKVQHGLATYQGDFKPTNFFSDGSYSVNYIADDDKTQTYEAFGLIYSEDCPEDGSVLMDFNRENDRPVSKRNKYAAMTVQTNDLFSVSGHGIHGSFSVLRSDHGVFIDETVRSTMVGGNYGNETGVGLQAPPPPPFLAGIMTSGHQGTDLGLSYTESYSGPWLDKFSQLDYLDHQEKKEWDEQNADPTYEPFYFRQTGEHTARDLTAMDDIGGKSPVVFKLDKVYKGGNNTGSAIGSAVSLVPSYQPQVKKLFGYSGSDEIQENRRADREKRTTNIQYRTVDEVVNDEYYVANTNRLEFYDQGVLEEYEYENANSMPHHLAQMQVLNTGGMRYNYDLPVYNLTQEDHAFALDENHEVSKYDNSKMVGYDEISASLANASGSDHFYSSTEVPAYVHSWLLTSVVAQDYVDMTGDGPTEDDLGYWCKFNYNRAHQNFQWRVPYKDALYDKGYFSDGSDDKASFTWGQKELYYVQSIETKTHIAVFETGVRFDGAEANGRHNTENADANPSALKRQRYLKSVTLYSKDDQNKPIRTVNFAYDYSLCPGIYNNTGEQPAQNDPNILANQGGKLTLKKVWITGLDNPKGALSPYEFEYNTHNDHTQVEFAYEPYQLDRWGNFQRDLGKRFQNENPYVDQRDDYDDERDDYASAWCLEKVTLPSGGEIEVTYEQDDYGYVQDKRATQMFEIAGFIKDTEPLNTSSITSKLKRNYSRVVFKLNGSGNTSADVLNAVDGLEEVYFKVWMNLLTNIPGLSEGSTTYYDYVTGFGTLKRDANGNLTEYGVLQNDDSYGYVTLENVSYTNRTDNGIDVNPIRKAAWQYLRYERPGITTPLSNGGWVTSVVNLLATFWLVAYDALHYLGSWYTGAAIKGYAREAQLNSADQEYRPSYIRLQSTDHTKHGGGNRVSKVTMKDNWLEDDASYVVNYDYTLENGESSGVAEYEPIVGGDENPMKLPRWDGDPNKREVLFNHPDAFTLDPIGEAYFPGANVCYSRVVVSSSGEPLNGLQIQTAAEGVTVNEFYTAKDFPILTKIKKGDPVEYKLKLNLPFIGTQSFGNKGYTTGYSITLNDMHGKPRRTAVYPANTDFTGNATTETIYHYQSKIGEKNKRELVNTVTVLDDHAQTRTAEIGVTHEFFLSQREHSNFSLSMGASWNVHANVLVIPGIPPIFQPVSLAPSFLPSLHYAEKMSREVSTTKVIYKSGILASIETKADGSGTTAHNVMYDAETGAPLLTRTTNEWDEPVFNYSYPAHWAYDGMDGAYHNYRQTFRVNFVSPPNTYEVIDWAGNPLPAEEHIHPGDELVFQENLTDIYRHLYVTDFDAVANTFTLETENAGAPAQGAYTLTVMRSGHRNLQGVTNGSIVSLSEPFPTGLLPLFLAYNSNISGSNAAQIFNVSHCDGVFEVIDVVAIGNNTIEFTLSGAGGNNCQSTIVLDNAIPGLDLNNVNIVGYNVVTGQVAITYVGEANPIIGQFNDPTDCFGYCDKVLHADAVVFSDDAAEWNYNYSDVGDPLIESGLPLSDELANGQANVYRYGNRGIWRTDRSFAYLVQREQQGNYSNYSRSDISKDGVYDHFTYFDWAGNDAVLDNPNWTWASHQTQYSPYGFALEEENALEIPSSQLFGYDNAVVVAAAANAKYNELAFDGFEDYPGDQYNSHGHLDFSSGVVLSRDQAHTGKVSLQLTSGQAVEFNAGNADYFTPQSGEEYTLSVWVHRDKPVNAHLSVSDGSGVLVTLDQANFTGEEIDGWGRWEANFLVADASAFNVTLSTSGGAGDTYFDDIRLQPFQSKMTTHVYDPITLWLAASLDDRNYATFYNYDSEGALVQKKVETERGVYTVQTIKTHGKENTTP